MLASEGLRHRQIEAHQPLSHTEQSNPYRANAYRL